MDWNDKQEFCKQKKHLVKCSESFTHAKWLATKQRAKVCNSWRGSKLTGLSPPVKCIYNILPNMWYIAVAHRSYNPILYFVWLLFSVFGKTVRHFFILWRVFSHHLNLTLSDARNVIFFNEKMITTTNLESASFCVENVFSAMFSDETVCKV